MIPGMKHPMNRVMKRDFLERVSVLLKPSNDEAEPLLAVMVLQIFEDPLIKGLIKTGRVWGKPLDSNIGRRGSKFNALNVSLEIIHEQEHVTASNMAIKFLQPVLHYHSGHPCLFVRGPNSPDCPHVESSQRMGLSCFSDEPTLESIGSSTICARDNRDPALILLQPRHWLCR